MRLPTGNGTQEDFDHHWYSADAWDSYRTDGDYYHGGEDINLKTGSNTDCGQPVYAVADGQITHTEEKTTGFGKHLHLKCSDVWFHYCHLQDILVNSGQSVAEGQLLGHIGSTGNSQYCHLHFEGKKKAIGVNAVAKTKEALLASWFNPIEYIKNAKGSSVPAHTIAIEIQTWERVRGNSESYDAVTDNLGLERNASKDTTIRRLDEIDNQIQNQEENTKKIDSLEKQLKLTQTKLENAQKELAEATPTEAWEEQKRLIEEAHASEILAIKAKENEHIAKAIEDYKLVIKQRDEKIKEIEEANDNPGTDFLRRISSRKFLLVAPAAVFDMIIAFAVLFFNYKPDAVAMATALASLNSVVALFVIPEAITDHKERMIDAKN